MRYYACYWNTNGTNDLIITNDEYEIVGSIPEAMFGVSVTVPRKNRMFADREAVFGVAILDECPVDYNEYIEVKEATLEEVINRRACNPMDPAGSKVIQALSDYVDNSTIKNIIG